MEFFDKIGKKASEAYKVTADKTGKIARETKLKFKMSELKTKVEDIYREIGKEIYEKHVENEEVPVDSINEKCNRIDEINDEIEEINKECLELRDKKKCQKCFKEIEKDMKFCPECGAKQEEKQEPAIEVEIVEEHENEQSEKMNEEQEEPKNEDTNIEKEQTNIEKTTEVEVNPDPQDITEEEVREAGKDIE